jgi:hypothetical protein
MTNLASEIVISNRLAGLELAKYVQLRLVNEHDSIEKIAEDFDNDTKFIMGIVEFLIDIKWVKQTSTGVYKTTRKGKNSIITRQKWLANFI